MLSISIHPRSVTPNPRTTKLRHALAATLFLIAAGLAGCDRAPAPTSGAPNGGSGAAAGADAAAASEPGAAEATDAAVPTVIDGAASDPLTVASEAQTDIEEAPVLDMAGYAGVRFGDTLDSLRERIGPEVPATDGSADCTYAEFPSMPGVRFMVEKGIVTRADVDGEIPNSAGVTIGQPLAEVRKAWPSAQETPDKYEPTGVTLKLPSADGRTGLVIEAVDGVVTGIRAGREPAVSYVESCG